MSKNLLDINHLVVHNIQENIMEDKNTINTNTANAQDTNDQSDVLLEIGKKFIEEHIELLKALANDDKE